MSKKFFQTTFWVARPELTAMGVVSALRWTHALRRGLRVVPPDIFFVEDCHD
jgi:hypothetical protein